MTHFNKIMAISGNKLLVADDSLTIQKVIRLALSNEGYEIQAVSDGNDAIQQISLFRPNVVLIDVSLPGKTAFEVKHAINEQGDFEEIRFVLMSSAFEKVDEQQAESVQFHGRLTKPFDPAHLRQVLNDVLAQVSAKRMEPTSILNLGLSKDKDVTPPPLQLDKMEENSKFDSYSEKTPPNGIVLGGGQEVSLGSGLATGGIVLGGGEPQEVQHFEHHSLGESSTLESVESDPLWDKVTPPPPGAHPPGGGTGEIDIKQLTETTIRMSGLNDYDWSIQEPTASKEPSSRTDITKPVPTLKPSESMEDLGGSTFNPSFAESVDEESISIKHQLAFDEAPAEVTGRKLLKRSASAIPVPPPPSSLMTSSNPELTPPNGIMGLSSVSSSMSGGIQGADLSGVQAMPLSTGQVEAVVERQLQESLEKMVQKILPEIAEKVIKQEISKLLQQI